MQDHTVNFCIHLLRFTPFSNKAKKLCNFKGRTTGGRRVGKEHGNEQNYKMVQRKQKYISTTKNRKLCRYQEDAKKGKQWINT